MNYWVPFLGFRELSADDVRSLDLDADWLWSALEFEWLGRGYVFFARPIGPNHKAGGTD